MTITVRTINNSPVEPFLERVVKEFDFKDDYFDEEDKEKIAEQFMEECNPEMRFDEIEVIADGRHI